MAEFKLGRIRFVWKGSWYTGAVYSVDDVVRYGGRTYICVVNHTAASEFQTDLTAANWALMSDGQEWKGDWSLNTTYKPNDIVKYGGYIYICNTGHTSTAVANDGLEVDIAKWDLFIEGFNYTSDWAISTRYKINDLVRYGNSIYLCTTAHVSAATTADGLEANSANWESFAKGFNWLNNWAINTRYKSNDTVRYGGQLYICITGHTSAATTALGLEPDQAKWQAVHPGIEYKGTHAGTTRYKVNDVVKYGANLYIATVGHTSTTDLNADSANWGLFIPGLEFEDSWSSSTQYQQGDIVTYGGFQYVALTLNSNKNPSTQTSDWDLFVTGFSLKGDYNNGTAYKTGDVVRVGGITYISIADTTGNRPPNVLYWDKLNEGLYWRGTWTNATYYDKGDIIRGAINTDTSYVAVTSHTANNVGPSTINEPGYAPGAGVDTSVWQLLAGGPENDTLSAQGDLLIYGASGPSRLAIGNPGQALVVNSAGTLPEWGYVGQIDQVYYVSPDGSDVPAPDGGVTLDRAWKSIRYALHQMDKGPRNPQAVNLLERNKAFIQDETIAWINAQIAGAISPFTGSFTYNAVKCRRDIGILIESVLHDLRHGGNRKSRMSALSYFTPAGASYVTGQTAETAAAIVRAAYIAQQVVSNNTSYSASQGTTLQVSDLTKNAEAGTTTSIETLMKLSSDAITAGVVTGIPTEVYPNTTLNVKTGTYQEILPMSVKERCAVVGDELRSTNIRPAGVITNSSDTQYSLQGIQRLEAIVSDVIQNSAVTVTPTGGVTGLTPTSGTVLGIADVTGTDVATTTTGSGTGLRVTVVCNAFQSYSSVTITSPGQGYGAGDQITIPSATSCNANSNNAATPLGADIVLNTTGVTSGNTLTQNTAVPAGSAAAATAATTLADNIEKYIDFKINANGSEPAMTGSNIPNTTAGYTDARLRLLANKDFIARECSEYVKRQNPSLNFNQTDCEDDIKDYVDAMIHDLYYTGNYESLKGAKWYVNSVQGSTTKDMFYMRNATGLRNCTLQGLSGTLGSANSYGTKRPTAGAFVSLDPGFGPNDYRTWIATTVAGTGQFTPTDGTYDPATGTTVLTIGAHQLQPGDTVRLATASLTFQCSQDNYGSNHAYPRASDPAAGAELMVEAVTPTTITINVGASGGGDQYVHRWVSATANAVQEEHVSRAGGRSPYVQNVTNFGTGATGLKIDGDIHAGGNDSIVANDFTQVISDGIGCWITNLGRAELVSVFSYYGHIGYLAENGGKIRATNGNSSYGDFGTVAEGVDSTEVPITAFVDNRSSDALVDSVFTDGSQILAMQYANAGREYSNATFTISGDGFGLNGVAATYNTGGVHEIRLGETPASNPSDFGGDGYVTTTNAAQDGNTTQITLAAADSSASGVYVGMALFITEGLGAGQYGYIDTYNASSKIATIKKFSDGNAGWDTLGGISVQADLDSTTIYEITPRVVIGAPAGDGSTGARSAVGRAVVASNKITKVLILDCGASYTTAPTVTFTDPNNTVDAPVQSFIGDGVLGQPTFVARGTDYVTASAIVTAQGTQATVNAITQASPAVITTSAAHNFSTNDKVTFTGILGMIELNTGVRYYVKVLNTTSFEIYADEDFATPIDSTNYTAYASGGTAELQGGFRDSLQSGKYVQVEGLSSLPRAGSNIQFSHLPTQYFKLVSVQSQLGTQTPYSALLQVSPDIKVSEAPEHGQEVTIRLRYSQVRLTGHDFLDIGTGNLAETNYPGLPTQNAIPANEAVEGGGGRVFFTSTDQDGNFRVGDLFNVEQATGIASLNADAFNISGLQELQLGDLALGGTSASIQEFSTDGTMAANSDAIVPTQRAIRTYIASQIGGGASSLNVNLITAGLVVITGNTISTSNGVAINMQSSVNFEKGVTGVPIAMNYLIHS
tara:strand:- start:3729 stop:9425 length:5697 start_codon:yes stop_codon:yes gene_type:complete